jgi:phosphoglycerate kinase
VTSLTSDSACVTQGVKFFLPTDVVIADEFKADAASKTVPVSAIPDGWMGLDIGPDSLASFKSELSDCQTVVWNGESDMILSSNDDLIA